MKATLFAVVLSLFLSPIVTYAEETVIDVPPAVSQDSPVIHLNQADVDTLTHSFKGIGRKRAEAIVAYREANGPFKSIEDLGLVKGIGKQFISKNLTELEKIYSVE